MPAKTPRGGSYQCGDRIIDAGKLIMPEPLHVDRLGPEGGFRTIRCEDQELYVEMKVGTPLQRTSCLESSAGSGSSAKSSSPLSSAASRIDAACMVWSPAST